jgi:hypothetical protein
VELPGCNLGEEGGDSKLVDMDDSEEVRLTASSESPNADERVSLIPGAAVEE